jgi:hypothetical protein
LIVISTDLPPRLLFFMDHSLARSSGVTPE